MSTRQTAEAFSSHRFTEVYDRLADNARWVVPGQDRSKARPTWWLRASQPPPSLASSPGWTSCASCRSPRTASRPSTRQTPQPDGSVSIVSSADIYEFDADSLLTKITSYAVELNG